MLVSTTTTTTTSRAMSRLVLLGWNFCVRNEILIISNNNLTLRTTTTSTASSSNYSSCMMRYCTAKSLLMQTSGTRSSTSANNSPSSSRITTYGINNNIRQLASAAYFSTRIPGRRTRRSSGGGGGGSGGGTADTTLEGSDAVGKNSSSARGGGGGGYNGNVGMMMTMEDFHFAANNLLDKVEEALTKLKDCNDRLEIVRHPPTAPAPFDESIPIDNGSTNPDDTILQHGGKLAITVLSSADLYWGGGTYSLTIYPDDDGNDVRGGGGGGGGGGTITLQSPLSGTYTYRYNISTKEWVGEDDGHSLLGMLTRDWIRQCNGVPDF